MTFDRLPNSRLILSVFPDQYLKNAIFGPLGQDEVVAVALLSRGL